MRLRFLGTFSVERDGRAVAGLSKPKLVALLAYLAASDAEAPRTRDTLLAMFWPERDEESARHALRQALFEIRQVLGEEGIVARGAGALELGPGIDCDVVQFRAARTAQLDAEALPLYGGELLAGFSLGGAPDFERWLSGQRALLAAAAAGTATRLAEAAREAGRVGEAGRLFTRATELTPYDEPLWRRRIELQATLGDRAGALVLYEQLTKLLEVDLGVSPAPETQKLVERIRKAPPLPVTPVTVPAAQTVGSRPPDRPRWRPGDRSYGVAAAVVLILALVGWFGRKAHPSPVSLVVADFTTATGDSDQARAIETALRVDLIQSPYLHAASPELITDARTRMRREAGPFTDALALELARREGRQAVIAGDLSRVGGAWVLTARVLATATGEESSAVRTTARDSTQLLDAAETLSRELRRALGESRISVAESPPLSRVTTSSLEALRLYSEVDRPGGTPEQGIALLRQAIAIDPQFGSAWWRLATILSAWGEPSEADQALIRAWELREHLPQPERGRVEAAYARSILHDRERARSALKALLVDHPDDPEALTILTDLAMRQGRWAEAEAYARRGHRSVDNYNAVVVLAAEGRTAAAESALGKPADPMGLRMRGELSAARGDFAAAERDLRASFDSAGDSRDNRAGARFTLAFVEEAAGRIDSAAHLVQRDLDERPPLPPGWVVTRTLYLARLEVWERRDTTAAVVRLRGLLASHLLDRMSPIDRPCNAVARLFAVVGDRAAAEHWYREQQRATPDTTSAAWQAAQAGLEGLAGAHVTAARRAAALTATLWPECPSCGIYPVAQEWDLAGQADSALVWFKRALATPGMRQVSADAGWRARALERVAVLQEERGDRRGAATALRELLDRWRNADATVADRRAAARTHLAILDAGIRLEDSVAPR